MHPLLKAESHKAQAFLALQELASRYADLEHNMVAFYVHPSEVKAKKHISKGALTLVPATDFGKFCTSAPKHSNLIVLAKGKATFHLEAPLRPRHL